MNYDVSFIYTEVRTITVQADSVEEAEATVKYMDTEQLVKTGTTIDVEEPLIINVMEA
jgi:hypothetical protein